MLGYMTGKKTCIFFQQYPEIGLFINKISPSSHLATKKDGMLPSGNHPIFSVFII